MPPSFSRPPQLQLDSSSRTGAARRPHTATSRPERHCAADFRVVFGVFVFVWRSAVVICLNSGQWAAGLRRIFLLGRGVGEEEGGLRLVYVRAPAMAPARPAVLYQTGTGLFCWGGDLAAF